MALGLPLQEGTRERIERRAGVRSLVLWVLRVVGVPKRELNRLDVGRRTSEARDRAWAHRVGDSARQTAEIRK